LQEFLLSTRALCFNRDQVHWCCSTEASELWPRGDSNWVRTGLKVSSLLGPDGAATVSSWCKIVDRYSALDLTVEKDRVSCDFRSSQAVSTKARMRIFCWPFGSWNPSVFTLVERRGFYPSYVGWLEASLNQLHTANWSWASVNCEVNMYEMGDEDSSSTLLCEIKDVRDSTAGDDPTGQAIGGRIVLQAPSMRVQLSEINVSHPSKFLFELWIESCSWLSECYARWDHGRPPGEILVELVFNWMNCQPLVQKGESTNTYCDLHGLILFVNDAQEDSHIRMGSLLWNEVLRRRTKRACTTRSCSFGYRHKLGKF